MTVGAQTSEDCGWGQCRTDGGAEERGGFSVRAVGLSPNSVINYLGEPDYSIDGFPNYSIFKASFCE